MNPETPSIPTLLIIDDSDSWIELASSYLELTFRFEYDIQGVFTRSGSEALQKVRELKPDVLVLDLNFSEYEDEEGIDITNKLHKEELHPKILLASANPKSYLEKIRPQFKTPIHIPGKNLLEINKCLNGSCTC